MEDTNQNPNSNPPAGDNWYDKAGIAPEFMTDKIRGFKDINAFAKSFNEGQAFIGKGIPDENTPADIADAFYAKLGRPESADKYSWQPPEGISVAGANAENFKAFKEECFKLGMTDKQVSGVLGRWSGIINDIMAAEQKKYAESIRVSKESLSAPNEWGDKYDDKLNAVLKRIDDMGIRTQLESAGVLYDARVLKAFDAVIGASRESKIKGADGKFISPDERLAQLRANPAFFQAGHPDHAAIIAEANEIFRQKAQQG